MKRAAIIVLAIATLVLIVSPSSCPLASTPAKSGTGTPNIVAKQGPTDIFGPSQLPGGGGNGGGTDQGDADGLSGLKVKPGTMPGSGVFTERVTITMMMWWRFMVLIR